MKSGSNLSEKILTGVPSATGIAIGEVFIYRHDTPNFREFTVPEEERPAEITRLEEAIKDTRSQLLNLKSRLAGQTGETVAAIFEAQSIFLDDEMYTGEIKQQISQDGINAESAVYKITEMMKEALAGLEGEQFQQPQNDIKDVGQRIIRNLLGVVRGASERLKGPSILVADDLLPSDIVRLINDQVLAVATDLGGATSHTAILARSLHVPAVVGLKDVSRSVKQGEKVIVNGNSGKVILRPDDATIKHYTKKRIRYEEYILSLSDIEKLPAETLDGKRIHLRGNLELPQEAQSIKSQGGEGVGLFRSEYLFLAKKRLPDEAFQIEEYTRVIKSVAPNPVTIRTFDLGGDKVFPDIPHPVEANPFMGWRALRVSLDQTEMLVTQLRAIFRAALTGPTKVMFPFINGLCEIRKVREQIDIVKEQLTKEKVPFNPDVKIGVMIELPSAVILADKLAKEVDFFSIGTNDLTQFTLAVDRGNELVRSYYQPIHPAILRMIQTTVTAGHKENIDVAICGEMAANPAATMLLVGLDIDELSVNSMALPEVKKIIRSIKYSEAKEYAARALELDTVQELKKFCLDEMKHRFADLPIWFNGDS